ncbi:hypothetical protein cypCar_00031433 [Cyprinus carpio]|nr:hypothetical protein cypCar_00031433 [Cyprinus carpio]
MADVTPVVVEKSLDDFFAKRDKKKKKEKGKGKEQATGGSGVTAMAVKKTKREKEKSTKSENQDAQMEKYTILCLSDSDEKEEEDYEKEEVGEDGEIILVTGDKVSGPWNKSSAPPSAAPVEEVEVPEPKAPGVYRPPGARLTSTKKGPTQGPPEIFNDTQFPSLLSTARHVETRKDREMEKTFEVVKHKSRVREGEGPGSMQHLQLDNQYAILGDK